MDGNRIDKVLIVLTVPNPKHLQQCLDSSISKGVTPLIVYRDRSPAGLLNVTDQVRPMAMATVNAFNALAVVASGMGWLTPIMDAIVHNVGSVLVMFASASLAIFPEREIIS